MNRLITDIILTAWYPPTPTEENFRQYKECGFDRIFLLGEYVDGAGTPKMEKSSRNVRQVRYQSFRRYIRQTRFN